MDKARWQKIKKLFDEASEKSDESQQEFLQDISQHDMELSLEIKSLLDASQDSEDFLASPASMEVEPRGKIAEGSGIRTYSYFKSSRVWFVIVLLVVAAILLGLWLR